MVNSPMFHELPAFSIVWGRQASLAPGRRSPWRVEPRRWEHHLELSITVIWSHLVKYSIDSTDFLFFWRLLCISLSLYIYIYYVCVWYLAQVGHGPAWRECSLVGCKMTEDDHRVIIGDMVDYKPVTTTLLIPSLWGCNGDRKVDA